MVRSAPELRSLDMQYAGSLLPVPSCIEAPTRTDGITARDSRDAVVERGLLLAGSDTTR
jgi:hypothetical protein